MKVKSDSPKGDDTLRVLTDEEIAAVAGGGPSPNWSPVSDDPNPNGGPSPSWSTVTPKD